MKALVFHGPYDLRLQELPTPKAGSREVLIKVAAVGICGSDIHGFTGQTGSRAIGMVMGHEISGIVSAMGRDAAGFSIGQHVAVQPIIPCNNCEMCRSGRTSICPSKKMIGVNMGTAGGLAEFLVVPQANVLPLPPGLPLAVGCLAEALAVGVSAARETRPQDGQTVLVVGSGMIGLCVVLALAGQGAKRVLAVDQSVRKLELARSLGALPINFTAEDPVQRVIAETGGKGADVAIEVVGASASVQTAQYSVKNGGRVLWIGNAQKMVEVNMKDLVIKGKSIQGIYCYSHGDFEAAIALLGRQRHLAARLVEQQVSPDDAPALFTKLAKGETELVRGVMNWGV